MNHWSKSPIKNLGTLPTVREQTLKDGLKGNLQTMEIMSKLARKYSGHPLVRRLATAIINANQIPDHHYLTESYYIGKWVQTNVRYVRDADGIEQLHAPDMLLRQIHEQGYTMADCDDMATLCAALLISVGVQPKFRAIRYEGKSGGYNHIYIVVYEADIKDSQAENLKQRLVIDCIIKDRDIGFEMNHASGDEYDV